MAVKTKDSITVYHVMDIYSVTWYYKLQSSTAAAPAKPTTDPPPSGWFTAEPAYTEGSTNSLYIVEKTVYSDGTFAYSDVSLSSSYEAAKTAYNKSVAAQNTASAAQTVAANAQTVAANAARTATKYITDLTDGIFVAPEGQGPNDTQTPTGWKIKDALELLQTGISYIWAGITNGVAGVRIGKQDEGNVFLSGSGYVDVRKSSTVLAHFGYDEGIALDGSIQVAPYYNLGIRKSNTTIGNYSTAEGYNTEAANFCSHAEGHATQASGSSSHAEGSLSKATGGSSHAEGSSTAEGTDSHAEGNLSKASGNNAHAEGSLTNAEGQDSHAEGSQTKAYGQRSHAEGYSCQALGDNSHASGHGCFAREENQTVIGRYNANDASAAFIIGNGTGLISCSNALTVEWNGTINTEGSLKAKSAIGTGGKLAWNDTAHDGAWISSTGEIHLTEQSASRGGTVSFHFGRSASATSSLYEGTSGVLTNTGRLVTSDWSGTGRTPVSSATTDGGRISYIQATAASLRVAGQWGTAGGSYTITDFLPPTSDIRLKKNVEDCEVEDALSVINRIRMRSFDWLHTDEHQRIGFIADELEEIDPKLAVGGGKEKDGTIHYKSVDTFYMMGYLVKAVQELSTEVERLRRELNGNHSES